MFKIDALPDVPRWAVLAAHTVPLVTVPSGLWRIAQVAGLPVAAQGVCYLPLLAWAPLLAATTVVYYRRRTTVL
ncbi:hypothetical protein [Streptomyces griseochromogenes]